MVYSWWNRLGSVLLGPRRTGLPLPRWGSDDCLRILLSCFRKRTSECGCSVVSITGLVKHRRWVKENACPRPCLPLRKRADYSNHLHSARGSEAWNINSSSRSRAWLIHRLQVCSVRLSGIWVWGLKSPKRFTKPRRMLLRSTNSAEEEGGGGGKEKIPRNECLVAPVLVVANCNSTITLRLYPRYRDPQDR